jgi:hypothetical protein
MSTFLCPGCSKLGSNLGSRVRLLEGRSSRVCSVCAPNLEAGKRSKKAKNPPRNDGFTTGKYGVPIGTPDYIGYDTRNQCSPEEIAQIKKTGYYSQEWKQLRGK